MGRPKLDESELIAKIRCLPPERRAQVEAFVDLLRLEDDGAGLTEAAARLSEAAFARIWENPDDADYDRL